MIGLQVSGNKATQYIDENVFCSSWLQMVCYVVKYKSK
mgnify:CR=1 FL=1